jgi:hypothetical protein
MDPRREEQAAKLTNFSSNSKAACKTRRNGARRGSDHETRGGVGAVGRRRHEAPAPAPAGSAINIAVGRELARPNLNLEEGGGVRVPAATLAISRTNSKWKRGRRQGMART